MRARAEGNRERRRKKDKAVEAGQKGRGGWECRPGSRRGAGACTGRRRDETLQLLCPPLGHLDLLLEVSGVGAQSGRW
jgi:hypothetical protein